MSLRDVLLLLVGGFLLRGFVDAAWEWWSQRPRRFKLGRDYSDPCGPKCKARHMSQIGWRARSARAVAVISRRLHTRVTRHRDSVTP